MKYNVPLEDQIIRFNDNGFEGELTRKHAKVFQNKLNSVNLGEAAKHVGFEKRRKVNKRED